MAGVLDGVNQRTQLVGQNRMELLLFRLGGRQRFGINVFKVREVIPCPALTRHPNASAVVRGMANIRGQTLPVIDLAQALRMRPIENPREHFVILTEFNRSVQGFLVDGVDRIVNMNWEEIKPPPRGMEHKGYMTAVTRVDDELVEIVDVEKVVAEVIGMKMDVSEAVREQVRHGGRAKRRVLVADDSTVAINQVRRALEQVEIECVLVRNGREALEQLRRWAEAGDVRDEIDMLVSDIEMPEMDGYTLTTEIRRDPKLKDLPVMLHSSLSGVFNTSMVEKVGANYWLSKFKADEMAQTVLDHVQAEEAAE